MSTATRTRTAQRWRTYLIFSSPGCRRHFNVAHSSAVSIFRSASRFFFRRKFDRFWSPIRRGYDVDDGGGGGGGGGDDEANSLRHTSLTVHINKSIVASLVIVIRPALPTDFYRNVICLVSGFPVFRYFLNPSGKLRKFLFQLPSPPRRLRPFTAAAHSWLCG